MSNPCYFTYISQPWVQFPFRQCENSPDFIQVLDILEKHIPPPPLPVPGIMGRLVCRKVELQILSKLAYRMCQGEGAGTSMHSKTLHIDLIADQLS